MEDLNFEIELKGNLQKLLKKLNNATKFFLYLTNNDDYKNLCTHQELDELNNTYTILNKQAIELRKFIRSISYNIKLINNEKNVSNII